MTNKPTLSVTPLAGVWIEIRQLFQDPEYDEVTPLAGVWIEIGLSMSSVNPERCHSPCGSVD